MQETLFTPHHPRHQSAFQLPPSALQYFLSIHFLSTPPSAVDFHLPPPPPNSTWLFSFWVISVPAMFIHDQGSEREIRSQVLSWPPGLPELQVTNKHTNYVKTLQKKHLLRKPVGTCKLVCICIHLKTLAGLFWVSCHVQTCDVASVKLHYCYQIETKSPAFLWCFCLSWKIFFCCCFLMSGPSDMTDPHLSAVFSTDTCTPLGRMFLFSKPSSCMYFCAVCRHVKWLEERERW